jgi:predicted N-acetyltransferase YhbS
VERPSFAVRALEPRDATSVAGLFADVFARPMTEAQVSWKLLRTPAVSAAPPSFVAECDGRLIGQYAGTPTRFSVDGETRIGLHGCDVMTAAEFRRRGVLLALGTAAHEAWRQAGLVFVTGLANAAWGTRSAALGWVNLFPLRWVALRLRPELALARQAGVPALERREEIGAAWRALTALRSPRDPSVQVRPLERPEDGIDALWDACRADWRLSVVRDRAWVEWRYLSAPAPRYRVLYATRRERPSGYVAFTHKDRVGTIAELFSARDDAGARAELLRAACAELLAEGAEVVTSLLIPGSAFWDSFRRAGFRPRGAYTFEIVPLDPAVPIEVLSDPGRWNLAAGDFDVV